AAVVVATYTSLATMCNEDEALCLCEGSVLLVWRVVPVQRCCRAAGAHPTATGVDAHQYVRGSAGLRDSEDQVGRRVIDGRASDAKWIDIPARKLGERNRCSNVGAPEHLPTTCIERVQRVVLGGDHHVPADDQRLGVHRPVQVYVPCLCERPWIERSRHVTGA